MKIRYAKQSDLASIESLISANVLTNLDSLDEGFMNGEYRSELIPYTIVALNDTTIVGVTVYRPLPDDIREFYGVSPSNVDAYYIHFTCIAKDHRRRSIASKLYDYAMATSLRDTDMYLAIMFAPYKNISSIKFHERLGFHLITTKLSDETGKTWGFYHKKFLVDI